MDTMPSAGDILFPAPAPFVSGRDAPTILVLDPDWDSRQILQTLLRASGYRTLEADSVPMAAVHATRYPLALIISESRDGVERRGLPAAIRRTPGLAHVPLIVYSSWLLLADRLAAAEHSALAFVTKPCDHRELLRHVERAVHAANDIGSFAHGAIAFT